MKIVNVVPVPEPRMTKADAWKARPAVLRYFAYRDILKLNLPKYVLPPKLEVEFVLPIPPSWSKKKVKMMCGMPHQQKPDIDNLLKAFMDAFGVDDSHVWEVTSRKYWGIKGQVVIKD